MKTTIKLLEAMRNITIIALIAVIGFSMTACDNGGGGRSSGRTGSGDTESGGSDTAVTFSSLTANGNSSATTTQLTLTFNQAITGLSAGDITLSGVSGVSKGTLSGSGPSYTLPVSGFSAGGTLNVSVAKSGYTISGSSKSVTIYYRHYSTIEQVWIPAGTFIMGSPLDEPDRFTDETQHQVTLTKGFYMGKYEITQAQYEMVMGSNPSYFSDSPAAGETQGKRPVEQVSWHDALVFCNKLSVMEGLTPAYSISGSTDPVVWGTVPTGYGYDWSQTWDAVIIVASSNGYRLPTEAQWEYACRAGTTTAYNLGNTWNDNWGWIRTNSNSMTHEVGKKSANAWGLYDMHGNVLEWCWDKYDKDYGGVAGAAVTDPVVEHDIRYSSSSRICRGGHWDDQYAPTWKNFCSARRTCYPPYKRENYHGLRVVRP